MLRRPNQRRVKNLTPARYRKPATLQIERLEPRIVLSSTPLITEFMAANDATLQDLSGDYPDWIEIHNPTASPIDLADWYLTDTSANLTRWQFPSESVSVLDPGEYQIVFASSKDGDPGLPVTELHTNFSLNADGEYLGLVMPDGVTIVHEYAPLYPEQLTDISYGAGGVIAIGDSLVGEGAGAAILVPANGSLGETWTGGQPFDDSAWQGGEIGVGYDTEGGTPWLYSLIDVGLLGQRIEPGAVGAGSSGNGVNLPTTQLESDTGDHFTIAIDNVNAEGSSVGGLDWRDRGDGSNDSLVALGEDQVKNNDGVIRVTLGSLPEGMYSVTSYHMDASFNQSEAIRIFVTDSVGTHVEQAVTANANIDAGDAGGLTTSEVISTSATYTVVSSGASDVIVLFDGTLANDTEAPLSGLRIERLGGAYEGLITTDLETAMFDQSGSAYLRIPFDVADPNLLASLALDIHYDDGFVAYLNGVKIAERNAPAVPAFDSVATTTHPDSQALVPETIDVSDHLDDLVAGENILAIHGLNSSSTSSDFLILPLLTATRTMESPATYYTTPTPGTVNVPGALGLVADTRFSIDRGFFDAPFSVEITTDTPEASIRYTTDGSVPTATAGTLYTESIDVSSTTILRAAAFRPGYLSTNVDTQTYLFLGDVLQQDGSGLPPYAAWGHAGADWEVDSDITGHADPDNRLTAADLQSVPTISLVLPWDDMFGGDGQGIYISGSGSPRGTSVEMILPDGSTGFQVDGSVQIQGGTSDNRWKSDKLSMRVKFTEVYGPTKLDYPLFGAAATDQFDTFILDATLNHSWTHPWLDQTDTAKFIQDQFVANIQNAMGGYAPHARYHHLYINGLYWGMSYVHERPDESFAADYLGGDKDDYDVLKHTSGTVVNGSTVNYQAMLTLARQDLSNDANFQNLAAVLDIDDLIDYMLVNFYAGNEDWDHHNWYATFNRVDPNGQWRFHSWDAEHVLESVSRNDTGEDTFGAPSEIHQNLTANAEYRRMFADHVQKHFFHGGVLTPASAADAYQQLMDEIDRAIVGESARWGDNRVSSPYTRDDWLDTQNDLLDNYFPNRTDSVLGQLQNRNLFPDVDAPAFNQQGGYVVSGYDLTIAAPAGTIYYTLDGSDPREIGGSISGTAVEYTGSPIDITSPMTVRTRALDAGEWSALNEADFTIAPPADASNLRITEINYNPHDPNLVPGLGELELDNDQFEFVELQNVGTETLDVSGVQFVEVLDGTDLEGIVFTFSQQMLAPGEHLLVVRNQAAFESRYGTGLPMAGEYDGKLANDGEQITLRDASGSDIQSFEYNDSGDWPGRADGKGSTLEVIDAAGDADNTADWGSADNWRSSNEFGGSPGATGTGPVRDVIVNEVLSHSDGDALDWIELFNTGATPVDMGRWYVSDTSGNLFQYQISAGTTIGAGHYLVLDETELGFGLDGQFGDDVWIVAADNATGKPLRFADHHDFDATDTGVSLGLWPNGDPSGMLFPMTAQTFGSANSGPTFGDLLITEVHYNPAEVPPEEQGNIAREELEFIELFNSGGSPLDIGDWSIQGIGLTFPAGTNVTAGEAIVVVTFDPIAEPVKAAAFHNVYSMDADARLFGAASGQLNNAGETVKLLRPEDPQTLMTGNVLVDAVRYDDLAPWPVTADGGGHSLTRVAPDDFAPWATSWMAVTPTPGSVAFSPSTPGDFDTDGDVDGDDLDLWETGFGMTTGANLSQGDADDDGDVDGNDFLNWQRNYSGSTAPGAAADSSASMVATDAGSIVLFSTTDAGAGTLNDAPTNSLGPVLASGSSQDVPPPAQTRVVVDGGSVDARSGPVLMNGSRTVWLDLPQFQWLQRAETEKFSLQRQPLQRDLAVDVVMSRLDAQTSHVDLKRPRETATEMAFASKTTDHNDTSRVAARLLPVLVDLFFHEYQDV